jgi:hypothetical protein
MVATAIARHERGEAHPSPVRWGGSRAHVWPGPVGAGIYGIPRLGTTGGGTIAAAAARALTRP